MKVGDLLHVAGEHELSGYAWGPALITALNHYLLDHVRDWTTQLIAGSHTGSQALQCLHLLPTDLLSEVLVRDFDTVKFIWEDDDHTPLMPVVVVKPEDALLSPAAPPKAWGGLLTGALIVLIALFTAMSAGDREDAPAPSQHDSSVILEAFKFLGEILKALVAK